MQIMQQFLKESRLSTPLQSSETALTEDEVRSRLKQVRALATLMDSAITIPGINRSIGLDSLIGLIPGIGDLASGGVAAIIVRQGIVMGIRKRVAAKMILNIAVDSLIGTIPLVGDLFDIAFKANLRNVDLLEQELDTVLQDQARASSN